MSQPGGLWGWGSCGMHLTWSAVLPGPRVWGYGSFSVPVLIHPAHQLVMFSISVYVIHPTVHTHTACAHRATTSVSSPGCFGSSAQLDSAQALPQGCSRGTVTQTGSPGNSRAFSGTWAQR